jgi:phospholipase/carboxylesterase
MIRQVDRYLQTRFEEEVGMNGTSVLPLRSGPRPRTTPWAPHIQQDQNASPATVDALAARVYALADVEERPGTVADPRERAIWLCDAVPAGPADAFLGNREIGHFHPWDNSLHIALPPDVAKAAVAAGWAEVHPVARAGMAPENKVMLYGPRDEGEVDVLFDLIAAAVRHAGGRGPGEAG